MPIGFPMASLNAGDLVVLYTKRGKSSVKKLNSGNTAHFYYWGEANALWGGVGNCAVLLAVEDWIFKPTG